MNRSVSETETLIIGGGLAGLSLAYHLSARRQPFVLAEARARFGGRILTKSVDGGQFDMGPAWFWAQQPRIAKLMTDLGLTAFEQFGKGGTVFEDEHGQVQQGRGSGSMAGSYRISGGVERLITGLCERLPAARLLNGLAIQELRQSSDGIIAAAQNGQQILAKQVVLALPPRLAANIEFDPVLPPAAMNAMRDVTTWMAGQAKAMAVYDTPFWRDVGLSGDAFSRRGPMVEVHDASAGAAGPYALFGFLGIPAAARQDPQALEQAVLAQFVRLFGAEAAAPRTLWIKDWAFDEWTATDLDHRPVFAHPRYGLPNALDGLWDDKLLFGGTEVAAQFGGYLEGGLEAAEAAAHALLKIEGAVSQ